MGLVFVLGGGGAAGAYQAGSILALAEAGMVPDALVGCSAGALNAAFLAADPSAQRAGALTDFWAAEATRAVLAPSMLDRVRGAPVMLRRGDALFDQRPLRRLLARTLEAHDLSELGVPLTVTTTCLDCGDAVHHDRGPLAEILLASCALPGLLSPVRLADGHAHVDGGVVCGVPVQAALDAAGADDLVLVLDAGLAPVTGTAGRCAATPDAAAACGLQALPDRRYVAPVERARARVLDVVLRSFTVARTVANRAAVAPAMTDPRVRVLPHLADAWAAGHLNALPASPRDFTRTADLLAAGRAATEAWLERGGATATADIEVSVGRHGPQRRVVNPGG